MHSSSVGPIRGFSPREMELEDGIDPEAVHPSPGLVEVPSWLPRGTQAGGLRALCPLGPWPVATQGAQPPAPGEGEEEGELGLHRWSHGSAPERLVGGTFRNKDEAGTWDSWGRASPASMGTARSGPNAYPRCQHCPCSTHSSGGHCSLGQGPIPPWGTPGIVPQQPPRLCREPWGCARGRPCPSLPMAPAVARKHPAAHTPS